MDILPVNNLTRIVENTKHNDHDNPKRRQPPPRRDKFVPVAVYTPDGHVEEESISKIEIIA
jgi:hypothetical protein